MSPGQRLDPKTARDELTDHPHYRYRGCAPDPDNPAVAAGNPGLPVTAWEAPDIDGGEPQAERIARERAAIDVCVGCAVMVPCLAYGSSVTREGRLAEPHAILGGMTALERHRQFVKARQQQTVARPRPAPVHQLRTRQKLAVLRALAAYTDPDQVADAAGVDLRTANWQRSILVGKLGLDRDASRMRLLDAAAAVGLLDGVTVAADDGSVPAVPPPGKTATVPVPEQQALTPAPPPPAAVPELAYDAPRRRARTGRPRARTGRPRGRFAVTGQLALALDLDDPTTPAVDPGPSTLAHLPATRTALLEPAA